MSKKKNGFEYELSGYDIAGHQRAEQKLLLSDKILQQMPNAIIVTDLEGNIQRWLGKATDIFGYSEKEALGKPISLIHWPQNDDDSTNKLLEQIKNQGDFSGEILCLTKDQRVIPVEASAKTIFDQLGRPIAMAGIMRNISVRKKAERALQESEERFRLAFENANIGVWLIDLEGALLRVNNRMCQILGYTQDELERMNVDDVTYREDISVPDDFITRSLAGKMDHISFEKRYVHKQGHLVWANVSSSLVRDSQGKPLYFISHVQDISQHKKTQLEREKLIHQLETKNAELERFSYTISHDLKSPLITIQGFLGFLEKDALNGNVDRLKRNIGFIRAAVDKMKHLIDDLLELSRVGRVASSRESISLGELVREAVAQVAGPIKLRGVTVHVAKSLPTVTGDRTRLLQVFQNLIDNAVKFIGNTPNPTITIGGHAEGNFIVCYVKDNGIGIDHRYHHRIFNLFDRLDTETEGSGVGLALTKRVVEIHGGQIWVESAGAGQGSTFWIKLPLA